jgi:hypothetical protein
MNRVVSSRWCPRSIFVIHDVGIVIECVGELARIRPIAMTETWVIWCDEMVITGESRK